MFSMALDNSWLVMSEEEMYDVNGGWTETSRYYDLGPTAQAFLGMSITAAGLSYAALKVLLKKVLNIFWDM